MSVQEWMEAFVEQKMWILAQERLSMQCANKCVYSITSIGSIFPLLWIRNFSHQLTAFTSLSSNHTLIYGCMSASLTLILCCGSITSILDKRSRAWLAEIENINLKIKNKDKRRASSFGSGLSPSQIYLVNVIHCILWEELCFEKTGGKGRKRDLSLLVKMVKREG